MKTFQITCQFCNQKLEAQEDWIGLEAECPFCSKTTKIERPKIKLKAVEPKNIKDKTAKIVADATGLDAVKNISYRSFFSEVFRKHTRDDIEKLLKRGSADNIPLITEVDTNWPKPWLFTRFLLFILIVMLLLFMNNQGPAFVFFGSLAIPLAWTVFFFEMNLRANVSIYTVLKAFLIAGLLSIFINRFTTAIAVIGGLTDLLGASIAGITEESAKLLAVIFITRNSRYNYILNGLLFGVAVGGGFSAFETLNYIYGYGEINVLIGRSWWSLFTDHGIWTGMTAGALWIVKGDKKFEFNMLLDVRFWRIAIIAVASHMIWNSSLAINSHVNDYINIVYMSIAIVNWIVIFCLIQSGINQIKKEKGQALADEPPAGNSQNAGVLQP